MATKIKKKKMIRTAPLLGAAATAGFFSMMGAAMASQISAQPASQIALSDDAGITLAALRHHHKHWRSIPEQTRPDTFGGKA